LLHRALSFHSPALLTHGQPGRLKRRKSAFLLVGHGPSGIALPTPAPFVYHAAKRLPGPPAASRRLGLSSNTLAAPFFDRNF
jgi:hypothetical protein